MSVHPEGIIRRLQHWLAAPFLAEIQWKSYQEGRSDEKAAASPQPVAPPQPSKRPSRPLKEYLADHPHVYQPPAGPTRLAPDLKRAILSGIGTSPKLNRDDVPLKRNPLARANDWIYQPMPTKPDESWVNSEPLPQPAKQDVWADVEVLASRSMPLPELDDDDNAPTAYGRAIMLDKVAKRAHKESEE